MGCDFLCYREILGIIGVFFELLIVSIEHWIAIIINHDFISFVIAITIGANIKAISSVVSRVIHYKLKLYFKIIWFFIWRFAKPYWIEVDISTALFEITTQINTHVFLIRVGKLSMNNNNYKNSMKHIIEVDHIWDWHFFTKSDSIVQDIGTWACDFFEYKDAQCFTINEKNTTTELGIVNTQSLRENIKLQKIFKQYKLSIAFDDIMIYGTIKGVADFPDFHKLRNLHLNNLHIEKIVLLYNDGLEAKIVDLGQIELADAIIEFVSNNYDTNKRLYIDKYLLEENKNSATNLAKELTTLAHFNKYEENDNTNQSTKEPKNDKTPN
ncbi:MAG: hypothetical protein NTZ60_01020 [Campylobacterales bacterium]|nr:hypothetical protein [Campylobacterales bacterium]